MIDSILMLLVVDMMFFLFIMLEYKDSEYEMLVYISQCMEFNVIVEDGLDSKFWLVEISVVVNLLFVVVWFLLCVFVVMFVKLDVVLVEFYCNLLVCEMYLYQILCDQVNLWCEYVLVVCYCLCMVFDEVVNNIIWGWCGVWVGKSLLVIFYGESEGGIKFFQIIGCLVVSFQEYGNVLEVIYYLLGLGFEGCYSVQLDGCK